MGDAFYSGRRRGLLPRPTTPFARAKFPSDAAGLLLRDGRFAAVQGLLERLRLLALLVSLAFGLGQEIVRLFLGVEQRLLLAVLRVAFRVLHDPQRLFLRPADGLGGDALAIGDPDGEHGRRRHQGDEDVYEEPVNRQHA